VRSPSWSGKFFVGLSRSNKFSDVSVSIQKPSSAAAAPQRRSATPLPSLTLLDTDSTDFVVRRFRWYSTGQPCLRVTSVYFRSYDGILLHLQTTEKEASYVMENIT